MKYFWIALIHFSLLFHQCLFNGTCSDPQLFKVMVSKISFPSQGESSSTFSFEFNLKRRILLKELHFYAFRRDSTSTFPYCFPCRRDFPFSIWAIRVLLAILLLITIEKFIFKYHTRGSTDSASNRARSNISIAHSYSSWRTVLHSHRGQYRKCKHYCNMQNIQWRFTLVMTEGSALTHGTEPVVRTIRPHVVYPLHIHTSLDVRSSGTDWPVLVVPTIRRHAVYPLHIHTSLDELCALTDGLGPVVPIKQPNAIFPLHIHTSLDGRICTHSRTSAHSANNTATCRISIAHSQYSGRMMCTHSPPIPVVPTLWRNAEYPLQLHTLLGGRCAATHGAVLIVPTILPHAIYPLHIQKNIDGRWARTDGPVTGVPTIQPQAVYRLHIHTCLDG